MSEEALQIAEKGREVKGKGERERYIQLNAEFQRMGKTRDLFKKTGVTKGTFLTKMDTIKDRNGKDITEAEKIKKRWQEYTEKLYRKVLLTWITRRVGSLT